MSAHRNLIGMLLVNNELSQICPDEVLHCLKNFFLLNHCQQLTMDSIAEQFLLKNAELKQYPMDIDLAGMPTQEIKIIYKKAYGELRKELLDGYSWEALKGRVDLLTQLSIELGKRTYSYDSDTPADSNIR